MPGRTKRGYSRRDENNLGNEQRDDARRYENAKRRIKRKVYGSRGCEVPHETSRADAQKRIVTATQPASSGKTPLTAIR